MKKLIGSLATLLVVVFMISMSSCEELNDIVPVPSMKATVDNEAWTSIFRITVVDSTAGSERIIITATPTASKTADETIIITVNGIEAKEYNLVIGGVTECAIVYKKTANAANGSNDYYVSYSATVNITKIDMEKKQVSGTFSASLVTSNDPLATEVNITNGTFENLNFQFEELIPIPSMKATVNGEQWTSIVRVSVFNESATPQNIVITGKPTTEETVDQAIVLTITGNDTGTYKWDILTQQFDGVVVYTLVTDAGNEVYASTEATITVTEMDKEKNTISGTFSAKCLDPVLVKEVVIENGTFENLNYTIK